MGLSWQQGPLAPGAIGRFPVPAPPPERLLYAEPLRRRMRVSFSGTWIADSQDAALLHEPGRYPVACFPLNDIADGVLYPAGYVTRHQDLGATEWYAVRAEDQSMNRAAWQHTVLPDDASELKGRVAFAWRAMDAFYEEDERILGHAAWSYEDACPEVGHLRPGVLRTRQSRGVPGRHPAQPGSRSQRHPARARPRPHPGRDADGEPAVTATSLSRRGAAAARSPRQRTAARRVADRPPSASGSAADPRADPRSPSAVLRRGNCPNGLA
jgi:uncharacterized protein (DUF427 family)